MEMAFSGGVTITRLQRYRRSDVRRDIVELRGRNGGQWDPSGSWPTHRLV